MLLWEMSADPLAASLLIWSVWSLRRCWLFSPQLGSYSLVFATNSLFQASCTSSAGFAARLGSDGGNQRVPKSCAICGVGLSAFQSSECLASVTTNPALLAVSVLVHAPGHCRVSEQQRSLRPMQTLHFEFAWHLSQPKSVWSTGSVTSSGLPVPYSASPLSAGISAERAWSSQYSDGLASSHKPTCSLYSDLLTIPSGTSL